MHPEIPIIKFLSPSRSDQGLIEFHNTKTAAYLPADLGTAHLNTRDYPNYKLAKQFNLPNDESWVVRIYVTDQPDPTWWNWAEKFSGDANAYPIFIREYREPRKTYAPLTKGQPLKSVYKLTLTTAGTGYTPGTLPALTFTNTGTGGTGAVGHAVVAPDGTIANLVLDDGGDGYNTAPTFTIAAPPSGTTATGTAVIQPATALLVAEEAQQFPQDSEFFGLYLSVVRLYETLPGPTLPYTRFDDDLGPVQGYRQAVLWNNQAAALTATGKTTYEARDGSSIVAWKIVEAWSDGTGGAGNPAYPLQQWTEFERDGVKKTVSRQLTPIADIVFDETNAGGVLTRKYSERYNEFLAFQIIETITVIDDALLDLPSFTTSIENLIPLIFRGSIATHIESHIIEGTAEETALALGEFEHTERQLTPLYKEVRSTILDDIGSLPIVITGIKETNEKKQVVSVTMTLEADNTTPTTPTATRDVDFKKLGNGLAIEITKTIPSVLDPAVFSKQRDDSVPERFKKATPAVTERHVVSGTAATPSLSSGDVAKSEQQQTAFTKETNVTNRAISGGYPTLEGQNYDQRLDDVIPYTENVDPAGTNIGSPDTEVTPLGTDIHGDDVELAKTFDLAAIAAILDAKSNIFTDTTNLNPFLPDVLLSITSVMSKSIGTGDADGDGSAGAAGPHGSYSLSLTDSAQSSAAISAELQINIKPPFSPNIPTKRYQFFMPMPVTDADILTRLTALAGATVNAWPDFRPVTESLIITGRRVALQVSAHAAVSYSYYGGDDPGDAGSETESTSYSKDVGITTQTVRISPTIHGAITLGGTTSDSQALTAEAAMAITGTVSASASESQSDSAAASVTPTSLSATGGVSAIPTSGLYLLRKNPTVFGYGYALYDCEVVDFANVH